MIDALGISLSQMHGYLLCDAPTFSELEEWIVATAGRPDRICIERLNADIVGTPHPRTIRRWLETIENSEPVLTQDDLSFWSENGYVVVKNAVTPEACAKAEKAIREYVSSASSLQDDMSVHGIMVELIQHHALETNRRATRIHKAFAQLWGTADLWVSADRCGFHEPQSEERPFPGPDLHWDMEFDLPIKFKTQGILYLTDTLPEQGALTLVPGFHNRLREWLQTLEPGIDPQAQDLHALGSVPIAGEAGDMIIWHHALPHGSRPNLGKHPRIVQYINMYPGRNYSRLTNRAIRSELGYVI